VEGQNKSITFDGREIRLTTGLYAPQANGSVMIECGDTSLLVTATKTTKKDASDFLPLILTMRKNYMLLEEFLVVL
jgi:polyribonucleotide nucleotidyltransferase